MRPGGSPVPPIQEAAVKPKLHCVIGGISRGLAIVAQRGILRLAATIARIQSQDALAGDLKSSVVLKIGYTNCDATLTWLICRNVIQLIFRRQICSPWLPMYEASNTVFFITREETSGSTDSSREAGSQSTAARAQNNACTFDSPDWDNHPSMAVGQARVSVGRTNLNLPLLSREDCRPSD